MIEIKKNTIFLFKANKDELKNLLNELEEEITLSEVNLNQQFNKIGSIKMANNMNQNDFSGKTKLDIVILKRKYNYFPINYSLIRLLL